MTEDFAIVDANHTGGHRKRLRERFLKGGAPSMPDYEILEMVLFSSHPRGDVKPLAKKLLTEFGDLAHVISATPAQLMAVDGIGEAAVASLKIIQEASVRLLSAEITADAPVLQSWKALLDYCRASMAYNKTEQFRIFFLDKKNKLISDELQQEGTIDHTPVYPREVIKRSLELSASSIILVHNHPSGDPTPSKADIDMTKLIMQAAGPLGIQIHDHLIIGGKKHYSFASNGLL
jgi:DNA repair protein RadC